MKKSTLLVSLLSILAMTACGGNDSNPDNPGTGGDEGGEQEVKVLTQETLEELAKGYVLESKVTEKINNNVHYFYSDSFHDGDSFTYKVYATSNSTPSRDQLTIFETYSKNENGNSVSERRSINNQKTYYKLTNPLTGDFIQFDTGYTNFFSFLDVTDFEENEGVYTLKESSIDKVSPFIITQLYGNEGFELDSLEISYVEDNLTLSVEAAPYIAGTTTYNYTFDVVVKDLGEDVNFAKRADPYEEVSDETFEGMLTALKNKNYKIVQQDYHQNKLSSTSTLIVNGNLTYRENEYDGTTYKIATYKDGDKYYEANNVDGKFVKTGEVDASIFNALFSSFNISRACFDLTNNKYVVKDDVTGDSSVFTPFISDVSEISNFSIEITNDSYFFTNIGGDYKTVVTFTNVGSADVGYTIDDIQDPTVDESSAWAQLLDSDSLAILTSIYGENVDLLPVPTDLNTTGWVDFGYEGEMSGLLFMGETPTPTQETVNAYYEQLTNAGFIDLEEEDSGLHMFCSADETIIVMVGIVPMADLIGVGEGSYFSIVSMLA